MKLSKNKIPKLLKSKYQTKKRFMKKKNSNKRFGNHKRTFRKKKLTNIRQKSVKNYLRNKKGGVKTLENRQAEAAEKNRIRQAEAAEKNRIRQAEAVERKRIRSENRVGDSEERRNRVDSAVANITGIRKHNNTLIEENRKAREELEALSPVVALRHCIQASK